MADNSEKAVRPWVAWLVVGIWTATALGVLFASRVHPATKANLSVRARKISFKTNASQILSQSDEEQLQVTGVSALQIQFGRPQKVHVGMDLRDMNSFTGEGDAATSCSLYLVRSQALEVREPAVITIETLESSKTDSFSVKSHGTINDSLSSLPNAHGLESGLECIGLRTNGGPPENVEVHFGAEGGDSIFLATTIDTRFDIAVQGHSEIGDTQIPILGEVRFSEVDPRTSEEKSVLIEPPEITFEDVNEKATANSADLLVVIPKSGFYLRQFTVKDGIQLSLHGNVRQILAGAGPNDLRTLMPSAFDRLSNSSRLFGAIPAIAGLLLGILEKAGALGKK